MNKVLNYCLEHFLDEHETKGLFLFECDEKFDQITGKDVNREKFEKITINIL